MRLGETLQLFLLLALTFRSTGLQIPLEGECVITPSEHSCAIKPDKGWRLSPPKGLPISAESDLQSRYFIQ